MFKRILSKGKYLFRRTKNRSGQSDIELLNLMKIDVPPIAKRNYQALINRPYIQSDFIFKSIKAQNPQLAELKKKFPYFGNVPISIFRTPEFQMLSHNDDQVAQIYFFFGKNSYEALSVALFAHFAKCSEIILDIGAYTGLFALAAANSNKAAKVHAFEPIEHTAKRIEVNAYQNGLDTITVYKKAITSSSGTARLTIYGQTEATTGSSLHIKKNEKYLKEVDVIIDTLDEIYAESIGDIGLIKLDTERDELNAIVGAKNLISESRPVLLVEILDDKALKSIKALLYNWNYSIAYIDDKNLELIFFPEETFSVARYGYGNIICLPCFEAVESAIKFVKQFKKAVSS